MALHISANRQKGGLVSCLVEHAPSGDYAQAAAWEALLRCQGPLGHAYRGNPGCK